MMWLSRFPVLMRAVFVLILGLTLAGAGAAHRPVERPGEAAALALFLQTGGSLADLCHDAAGGAHGGGHANMECPACQLQKAGCLAAVVTLPLLQPFARAETILPAAPRLAFGGPRDDRPPARGPPLSFLS